MVSQPIPEPLRPVYALKRPDDFPETYWLPTLQGQEYQLAFRYYAPSRDVVNGTPFPARLMKALAGDAT